MRTYVEKLLARGDVRIVEREVDPRFELAAVVERSQAESSQPILFNKVRGSNLRVLSNLYASNARLCEIIGAEPGRLCARWLEIMERIDFGKNPLQLTDTVYPTKPVSISELPQIVWRGKDSGPYITAGVFYAVDPETGVGNLSFCRAYMHSEQKLLCCIDPPHDLAGYQAKAERMEKPLDVAILIGPPVEVFLAACASVPYDMDEMHIAAGIRGEPIPVRPAQSINLHIPVETECVIEGRILPGVRETEGPFGEFMGYYCAPNPGGYVFEVTRSYARVDAIFHGILCGSAEDLSCLDIAFATRTYKAIKDKVPGVLDVCCNPMFYCTVVKIDKTYARQPEEVMDAVFDANKNYNFACIVVDRDVNIHDLADVFKAFLTRGRVDRRVKVISDVRGWDQSPDPLYAGRLGIDATMPIGAEREFERVSTPGAAEINLKDYLA